MVDKLVWKVTLETGIINMFKDNIKMSPLARQDDTLGIIECGVQKNVMNAFLNKRTSLINLQYGSNKYIKIHIGNNNICGNLFRAICGVMELVKDENEKIKLVDKYIRKVAMENVTLKNTSGI